MLNRKLILALGALAAIGGAAALAQTGDAPVPGPASGEATQDGADQGERGARGGWWRGGQRGEGRGGGRRGSDRGLTLEDFEARARERFARIDRNGDNVLDASEIESHMSRNRAGKGKGNGAGRQMGGRMLERLDRDKDGKVTKAELEQHLKSSFARLDLDSDGRITDADLPPMMRGQNFLAGGADRPMGMMHRHGADGRGMHGQRGERGGGRMLMRLRGADTNKDGSVTFQEFAAPAIAHFERMDRNKDANIDQSDFDAMRKEMVDYRVAQFIHDFGSEASKARTVTREQFLARAKERFERRDRSGPQGDGPRHGRHRGHQDR